MAFKTYFAYLFLTVICSCHNSSKLAEPAIAPTNQESQLKEKNYHSGTIKDYTGLDGCSFVIELENKKKLEPAGLHDSLKIDGLNIWIKYAPMKEAMSICMVGQVIKVLDVIKVHEGLRK